MSDTTKKTLDDFAVLTEPGRMDETMKYNLQAIVSYCKNKGIEPVDLSEEELEQFKRN